MNASERSLELVPGTRLPEVILTSPIRQPLIYRKRIRHIDAAAKTGDWVSVWAPIPPGKQPGLISPATPAANSPQLETGDSSLQLLGYGLLNKKSEITVRLIRSGANPPDHNFWNDLLTRAIEMRTSLLNLPATTSAYRLIHAESDGLPGVVIDRYGDTLSAEFFSLAMHQRGIPLLERLCELTGCPHYWIRPSPHSLAQENFTDAPKCSPNAPQQTIVEEYGTRFRVDLAGGGHKTGFFCDQRDNRRKLAELSAGRSVLDLCCYTGGFAIQALKLGQAGEVIGVDLDEGPLAVARENAKLNRVSGRFVNADIFPFMRDMLRNGKQFDVVVLDPPKLIRNRDEYEEGKRAHADMNRLACRLVRPGGLLLTCTCAGLLSAADFQEVVIRATWARPALDPHDPVQQALAREIPAKILFRTGAGPDHPVATHMLETEYLQGLWLQIG